MENPAFVFDDVRVTPDRQIGWHSHNSWELSYVICGGGTRTIGDLTEPIQEGEIILIPPAVPHVWRFDPSVTDEEGCIANISVLFEPRLVGSMIGLFPEVRPALELIRSIREAVFYSGATYAELRRLLLSMRGVNADRRLPVMIRVLLTLCDTTESRPVGKDNTLSRTELRLEKVRVYCACNYARHLTLDEISRHTGMNRSAFCTFMRRHTGMSFSGYLNRMRLERAMEKLKRSPDCGIAEIAMDCGFQNISYFNRLFRSRYGCTPTSLRPR